MQQRLKTLYGWVRPSTNSAICLGWTYREYTVIEEEDEVYFINDDLANSLLPLIKKHPAPVGEGWQLGYYIVTDTPAAGF